MIVGGIIWYNCNYQPKLVRSIVFIRHFMPVEAYPCGVPVEGCRSAFPGPSLFDPMSGSMMVIFKALHSNVSPIIHT